MPDKGDSFLGRWSRRKQGEREGKPLDEPTPAPAAASVAAPVAPPVPSAGPVEATLAEKPAAQAEPALPLPTLKDTDALTPASDFKPFMAQGVASEVKNAAMKKLFADPHFNVMDRLDIYIEDYNLTTPIPPALLRQMASARFLGLFDDEEAKEKAALAAADPAKPPPPRETGEAAPAPDVAQSGVPNEKPDPEAAADPTALPGTAPESHADLDLRLQPDDAAPAQSPRGGAG